MPQNKFLHKKVGLLQGQAQTVSDIDQSAGLLFSLKHFDSTQGQGFSEWEKEELLSQMMERFRLHCATSNYNQCFSEKFKKYPSFPANSDFKHPQHIPPDAIWASMHIRGKECAVGHMLRNVFYLVFLDRHHRFYITQLRHT